MSGKVKDCETVVRRPYLGGEGSCFLSKRKTGRWFWQGKVHMRCSPAEKESLQWMARELGLIMRGTPYSLTELIEITGYFAWQKKLHLLAEMEKLLSPNAGTVH